MKTFKSTSYLVEQNFPILAYQKIIDAHVYIILPEDILFILCFFKNHISLQYKILTCIVRNL